MEDQERPIVNPCDGCRAHENKTYDFDCPPCPHWDGKPHYFTVITLCGSTKFKSEFEQAMKDLTIQGNIVLSVGCFGHAENDPRIWENKEMLDEIHKRKIDLSDFIFVINPGGYIGESTRSEINYAQAHGKGVEYMDHSNVR